MSSSDDEEIENTPQNGIHERKPKYVKRLNFGQSILNLNTVDRPNTFSSNNFIISKHVAKIPSTDKEDFVRQWIEVHNCNIDLCSNGSNQSSPVLGASKFKQAETSPVLGICKYQNRTSPKLDNNLMKKKLYKQVETSPVLGTLKRKNRKKLYFSAEKKQIKVHADECVNGKRSPLSANLRHSNQKNVNVNSSPVLAREAYCYKRNRRRTITENNAAHQLNTFTMETNDGIDKNMNLLLPLNASKDPNPLSPEISSSVPKRKIKYNINTNICDKKKNVIACRLPAVMSQENVVKINSLKDKTSPVIESVSSDDSDAKDINTSSDEAISDIIEDIDTQETVPLAKTSVSKAMNKWIAASPKSSEDTFYSEAEVNKDKTFSQMINKENVDSSKDSDKTYFSKAEIIPFVPSTFSSNSQDKISQVTVFSNESIDSRSSQTNFIISNVTSPVRTNSWPTMSLQIIDSCKKKRRVKKKSLAGKLQSLISRQTSFVRMWHHQMKQADMDGTSLPHIVVYVDKCTVQFYRQFLEGIVLDDSFNLLHNNGIDEKCDMLKSSSTMQPNKMLTMFIIPDIAGKIEMKSESIIKVYPPWDTMDESKMILNITYIKIMSNEQRNLILSKIKIPDQKKDKVLIKEFNCPCLEADKILSSCKDRSSDEKPDVMEELFKF